MSEQAEQTVLIKITGKNLVVPKMQLTEDSLKFRHLFDELNLADHEIYDFSPEVVEYFIDLLKTKEFNSIEDSMFRELHKLSVVFEVKWLTDKCREWLAKKMESARSKRGKAFLFEESWFILDKWKDNAMIDKLISELAHQDNLDLLSDYLSDISQLKTGRIDVLLKLGGGNAEFFLEHILQNLAGQKTLNSKVKYLLDNMNLALCCEVNEDLYLEVMDKISDLQEISLNDLRSVHQLMLNVAGQVISRKKGRVGRQTWAPPEMLQRRRRALFHSAAFRRLDPIFGQHNHCTTD